MKIWLDRAPVLHRRSDDCGDCTRRSNDTSCIELPLNEADLLPVRSGTLHQTVPLFMQMISCEHWMVCNPTGQGYIVVLDAEAHALLEHYCSPRSLVELFLLKAEISPARIESMVALFFKLGFLEKHEARMKREDAGECLSA